MPAIPDRWIPYKACGNIIEGTRFICFKVPLKRSVQTGVRDIQEIWDIPALLNKVPKLGAVIDLTNTARYYNPAELQAAGVLHKKILMPGRIIPPENKVTENNETKTSTSASGFDNTDNSLVTLDSVDAQPSETAVFMDAIDEFLGKDDDFLIGIHCTHGLNRTGYMVCRYMRDRLGVPAKDAIKKFENARGYQIERDNYIADLLGTPAPEPDVGPHTDIKPVSNRHSRSIRSPLAIEEENDEHQQRDRYNRYNRNRYNERSGRSYGNSSRSNGNDNRSNNYNWTSRRYKQPNFRKQDDNGWSRRSRKDSDRTKSSSESSSFSYDFRYDY